MPHFTFKPIISFASSCKRCFGIIKKLPFPDLSVNFKGTYHQRYSVFDPRWQQKVFWSKIKNWINQSKIFKLRKMRWKYQIITFIIGFTVFSFFFKWANHGLFLFIFVLFTFQSKWQIYNLNNRNWKSVDGVLGTRTPGGRIPFLVSIVKTKWHILFVLSKYTAYCLEQRILTLSVYRFAVRPQGHYVQCFLCSWNIIKL